MSQTIDNLSAAVEAALAKISELSAENTALASQNTILETRNAVLETASAADTAAEQDATQKLNAGVAAAAPAQPLTTAEMDASAIM